MARRLVNRLLRSFLQLNLYKKSSSTEQTTIKELLATRLYVCSLSIIIFIIAITSVFLVRTSNNIEYSPSSIRFSQLASKYLNTLHCPCSHIGIPYHTFVTTHVRFHQVCSSRFIQQTWIDRVFSQYNTSSLSSDDFRLTLAFFWQLIEGFCTMSNRTWNDTLTAFETSHLFSPNAIPEDLLYGQVKSILNNQINLAQAKVNYDLLSIRRLTSANQFVSALATNYYLRYPPQDSNRESSPKMSPRIFNNCSCLSIEGCPHSVTVNDNLGHMISIPGMINDCLIIDGTLASTLECYYNHTCLSLLHRSLPPYIQPLSNTLNKQFMMNSTIEQILNELMIDEMINDIQYDFYYSHCKPTYCSYSYEHQFDVLFVITTIIGIYGGLSFVLNFISPYIAIIILKWKNRNVSNNSARVNQPNKFQILRNYLRQTTINLNLFERNIPRTSINIYREQLFTRIFILLLLISSIIAGFYTFFPVQTQLITISAPSIDTYQQLYENYSNTLQCPCTKVSVPYGSFVNVTFILHEVCSSDFISSKWLNYLTLFDPILLPSDTVSALARDFRTTGVSYFQLLSTFCSLAKNNIEYAKRIFINNQFVNTYVPSLSSFKQQTQAMIEPYISNTQNDFKRTFDWIYISVIINYILTGANTNFHITVNENNTLIIDELQVAVVKEITHEGLRQSGICICPTEPWTCTSANLLYINRTDFYEFEQFFQELRIGCIPLTGFLESTFEWWYNETYIKNIQATYSVVIYSQPMLNMNSLNRSIPTRFRNNRLEDLLKEMFVETSINRTDFNQFYNACAPVSCSYTVMQRRNIIVALFLFISIYGGISEILRILVPTCGKLIFFLIDWRNSRDVRERTASIRTRLKQLVHVIYQSTINMNLYQTGSNDDTIIRQQRVHTKTYLVLFIACLSVILFYTAIVQRTITLPHHLSSIKDYEYLLDAHFDDVNCPCTRIAISYHDLIVDLRINQFHEACSTKVIDIILTGGDWYTPGTVYPDEKDFRNFRDIFIKGLQQLCILSKESINNSITIFRDSTVFFNQLISADQFYNEMNVTLNRFKQKTPIEFARTLDLIRTNTQGNALMGIFSTNWKFVVEEDNRRYTSFHSKPITYIDTLHNTSCSCATSQFCTIPAQIFYENGTVQYTSESLKFGCNSLETILLSSFSCFYSMICINELRETLELSMDDLEYFKNELGDIIQLNSSLTRFNINDTIERLAYDMFIESWITNVSYERFFDTCAPTYCTYKIYYRFDRTEIITTFLSVYAGLSFAIHFLVPYLIRMINTIRNRMRVTPVSSIF